MGHVTLSLNGRTYYLRCGDGQESRLRELADNIARRIDTLAMEFGQYGDERLLLMVTLQLADELLDLKAALPTPLDETDFADPDLDEATVSGTADSAAPLPGDEYADPALQQFDELFAGDVDAYRHLEEELAPDVARELAVAVEPSDLDPSRLRGLASSRSSLEERLAAARTGRPKRNR
jgi:cell division protein ZapA